MRPGPEGLPDAMAAAFESRGGRPRSEAKRVPVSLRIDPEVLAAFKATGAGWQTRMTDALDRRPGYRIQNDGLGSCAASCFFRKPETTFRDDVLAEAAKRLRSA